MHRQVGCDNMKVCGRYICSGQKKKSRYISTGPPIRLSDSQWVGGEPAARYFNIGL
ncbi:MAG: hypothetical protein BWY39_00275 [Spirochaetes bacterium ADurb.Bin269]|nr:MAG: hypothetical protein BWY39_00275 [Spirochaetes bacterium ADurb.Bin269]